MFQPPSSDKAEAALDPIWFNTQRTKDVLGLYEGISKHADEINVHHGYFFGLVQSISLEQAVLGICRLFDKSSSKFQKNTIPDLFDYLITHVTDTYVVRLKIKNLTSLGISQHVANQLYAGLHTNFNNTKPDFIENIKNLMPNVTKNKSLKQLFTYRNKMLAHQERLDVVLKKQLSYLPSLHEMEQLNNWAINLFLLANNMLTNRSVIPNGRSARIASLNIVAKVIERKFESRADRESFFAPI